MRIDVSDIFPELQTKIVGEEIEVKIKLDDTQYAVFIAWLDKNAQKEKEVHQKDVYYDKADPKESFFFVHQDEQGKSYIEALRSVRIRYSGNKIMVNTKLRHMNEFGAITRCDEFEQPKTQTEIEAFRKLLAQNGYVEKLVIEKDRTIYNVNQIEVALDKVRGLDGFFVELELKKSNMSTQLGKQLLYDLLLDLGIQKFYQYKRGYLAMLTNQEYNFEELVVLGYKK